MIKIPGKIPVSIYPFFWVLALIIGWLNTESIVGTGIWTIIIVGSVLVHEFGHALTAVAFGQNAQIELVGFGGVTQRKGGGRLKFWQEFLIVFNGPLAGFCLSGIAWWIYRPLLAAHPESLLTYAAEITYYVNLFWTILNLLPVQPLDGGKLLSILLESIFGLKGTKIALFISLILAAGIGILFLVMREFFIGSLFMLFTFESYRAWKQSLSLTKEDQSFIVQHLLKEGEKEQRAGRKEEALTIFTRIREMTNAGVIYQTATESAALILTEKGNFKEAYDLLSPLNKKLSSQGVNLLHQLAYSQEYWEEASLLGDRAFRNHPTYQVAIINAASHAAVGRVKQAINWIQCAIHEGIPNLQEALAKPEFDTIRSDPRFQNFLSN